MSGIYAFGLIAIDQLKALQGNKAQLDLTTLSRKQLIIDMEDPRNLARWFKFAYRFAGL